MLSNLNSEQQKAVLQVEGPVMVFAGAGTGKTRTLTYRVAYMIDNKSIKPYNILAITFTNKATNEMKTRLYDLIGTNASGVTISTFHSLAARILRREIEVLGYQRNFSIIDTDEQLKEITTVLKEKNIDRKSYSSKQMQKMISFHKCFNTMPKDLTEKRIFNGYNELLQEKNLLDFDDLLIKIHELFTNFPDILKRYQDLYKYILVDEFQDTNLIQYEIVKMLSINSRNIFVVGDDDQSIYSFRGTNYENMNLFKTDFKEHKMFFLTTNYRSTQKILDGCNRLIANNLNREKKELKSDIAGEDTDVEIFQAYNEKVEVDYILEKIFALKLKGVRESEIAILYRNSVLSRNIELGIIQMGFPYHVFGGISYLRRREIKDIIAYLKLIVNNNDVHSFERIVNTPSRALGLVTVEKVLELKKKYKLKLFDAIDACKTIISEKRYQTLIEFKNLIVSLGKMMDEAPLVEVYEKLLKETNFRDYLKQEDDAEERLENIEEFKSILLEIEETDTGETRRDLLEVAFDEAILSDDKLQSQKQNHDGITLSTIHSVKGLEFKYVFIIGLEENVFPNTYRFSTDDELEEERRIAYVAMTRAKKKLYLISAENRLLYGERFPNKISRFVIEFTGVKPKNTVKEETIKYNEFDQSSDIVDKVKVTVEKEKVDYQVGDKVVHNSFGTGIIVAIKDGIGQIFFDKISGLKSILLDHPSLKKE